MEIAFFWIILAVVVGVAANTRGRNGFGWFVLAVIISPLLAGLFVLALPSLHTGVGRRKHSGLWPKITQTIQIAQGSYPRQR